MQLTAKSMLSLIATSLRTPREAARILMASGLDRNTRWLALVALVVCGSVLSILATYALVGQLGLFLGFIFATPLAATIVQLSATIFTVFAIFWIGRSLGGQGSFDDSIILVAWTQLVIIGLQLLQLLTFYLLRPVSGLVDIAAAILSVWMLVGFIAELHGFQSLFRVFLVLLATVFAMAFGLSLILSLIGISIPGVPV